MAINPDSDLFKAHRKIHDALKAKIHSWICDFLNDARRVA